MQRAQLAKLLEVLSLLSATIGALCLAFASTGKTYHFPPVLAWMLAMISIFLLGIPALKWASDLVLPIRQERKSPFDEGGLSAEEIGNLVKYSPLLYKALAAIGLVVGIGALAFQNNESLRLDDVLTGGNLRSIGGALVFFSLLFLPVHGSIARWKRYGDA